jgi:hypothetical protein
MAIDDGMIPATTQDIFTAALLEEVRGLRRDIQGFMAVAQQTTSSPDTKPEPKQESPKPQPRPATVRVKER